MPRLDDPLIQAALKRHKFKAPGTAQAGRGAFLECNFRRDGPLDRFENRRGLRGGSAPARRGESVLHAPDCRPFPLIVMRPLQLDAPSLRVHPINERSERPRFAER